MRRLLLIAIAALTLAACNPERPVRDHLTLDFAAGRDPNQVRVVASTTLAVYPEAPRELTSRLDTQREAIINGRDDWGVRFARVAPENERVIFDRTHGTIEHVEHSAIVKREQMLNFFSDLPVTVSLTYVDGFTELAIYPASSTRATREQREHFERTMQFWSEGVARYLASMHSIYSYLDTQPRRAEIVFAALLTDNPDLLLTEDEKALVNTASDAMHDLETRIEAVGEDSYSLTEEADLVYQPLSMDLTVKLPGPIAFSEGFERHDHSVTITRPTLLEVVSTLEGRWLSPDPLMLQLRNRGTDKPLDIAAIAAEPRESGPVVTATEIANAVTSQLKPATSYRVRWSDN